MTKTYGVRLPDDSPILAALHETKAELQEEGRVGGLSPADVLTEAVLDPDVESALLEALEARRGEPAETMATILDRKADGEEAKVRQKVEQMREHARKLREPEGGGS